MQPTGREPLWIEPLRSGVGDRGDRIIIGSIGLEGIDGNRTNLGHEDRIIIGCQGFNPSIYTQREFGQLLLEFNPST